MAVVLLKREAFVSFNGDSTSRENRSLKIQLFPNGLTVRLASAKFCESAGIEFNPASVLLFCSAA